MDQEIVAKSDEIIVSPEALAPPPIEPEPEPEPPPLLSKTLAEIANLLNVDPNRPDLQRDLSIAYDEVGDGRAEYDNLIGAFECFEASIMIVRRLAKA